MRRVRTPEPPEYPQFFWFPEASQTMKYRVKPVM
jgi:hypothetical protein